MSRETSKARILDYLRTRYHPNTAHFPYFIASGVGLSEAYVRRLLNELAAEHLVRRFAPSPEVVFQYLPPRRPGSDPKGGEG